MSFAFPWLLMPQHGAQHILSVTLLYSAATAQELIFRNDIEDMVKRHPSILKAEVRRPITQGPHT